MRLSVAALCTGAMGSDVAYGGHKMERQFTSYNKVPVGENDLLQSGWHKHSDAGCDSHLGVAWTKKSEGPTEGEPLIIYTTAGGQQSGVGTMIIGWHGLDSVHPNQQKWTTAPSSIVVGNSNQFQINVAFRSGSIVCSGAVDSSLDLVGDVLIVNPGGQHSKHLPLTYRESESQGWHRGSCFDGMGWHSFLDTSRMDGTMSWGSPANLFPVVTMYNDEGVINAFFFTSVQSQISIPLVKYNGWEPVALSDSNMCKNTCDSDCTFGDLGKNGPWSTMHIYLRDHRDTVCPKRLHCFVPGISCCEKSADDISEVQV